MLSDVLYFRVDYFYIARTMRLLLKPACNTFPEDQNIDSLVFISKSLNLMHIDNSSSSHILKTPKLLPSLRPSPSFTVAALKPIPSTLLVCAGGMTPSSHNLADEKTASLSRSMRSFKCGSTDLPTASMTADSCCEPMTPILALGHIQRKRGE